MGTEISRSVFTEEDFAAFKNHLRQETKILMEWCRDDAFDKDGSCIGLELEAWLTDRNAEPAALGDLFIHHIQSDLVVPELSKFNFELNTAPRDLQGKVFSDFEEGLNTTWKKCYEAADIIDAQAVSVGCLPTVRAEHLTIGNMSPHQRYFALNDSVLQQRDGQPLHIEIEGNDKLDIVHNDIMIEAAATSQQLHLQVSLENSGRVFNASHIVSGPMVAMGANSPFLFGKSLWEETRIPTFEKSISVKCFSDLHHNNVGRVSFGTGYVQKSILEPFLENLDGFPVLLPHCADGPSESLYHLKLHNGTIWRWNRPLVGTNSDGTPHLRIEHRVLGAPPTVVDAVAQTAFFMGATLALAEMDSPPEKEFPFIELEKDFYQCARKGLDAEISWFGQRQSVGAVILEWLLPRAKAKLIERGCEAKDVEYYLEEIIGERVRSKQNGALWQRKSLAKHQGDFSALTQDYIDHQKTGQPVHKWSL